jgi:hypothetical protein
MSHRDSPCTPCLCGFLFLLLATSCATRHVLFDDFDTPDLAKRGWILRTEPGWPGVAGATWGGITTQDGIVRMTASTDGTPERTQQAQLCHQRKYFQGTYAARVRFFDGPASGPDGDQIVETFYFSSPQKAPMDPDYSEVDFEYLPNGGWGKTDPTMHMTTWETFMLDPWKADNATNNVAGSLDGWHTLIAQIGNGKVRYFVDGRQLAEHGDRFYPESIMSINFNLWFVRNGQIGGTDTRTWTEEIDWVYFRGGKPQSPEAVDAAVAALRGKFKDTVPATGLVSPCNF